MAGRPLDEHITVTNFVESSVKSHVGKLEMSSKEM